MIIGAIDKNYYDADNKNKAVDIIFENKNKNKRQTE